MRNLVSHNVLSKLMNFILNYYPYIPKLTMKLSAILRNIAEGASDPQTLVKKIQNPSLVSFVFCKNLKLFSTTELGGNIQRIIDVGANEGQFAFMARYCWPLAQIDCYEPDPSAYSKLMNLYKNDPKIQVNNYAIGSISGTLKLNLGQVSATNSFLVEKNKPSCGSIEVGVKTLNEIYYQQNLENSLLKIDVQGYELEVLKGASEILGQISFVLVEISLAEIFEGGPSIIDIWQLLTNYGYVYYRIIDQYREPETERIVQMDILFYRKK